ncbi:MAG: polyphosphate polymerase domain-containing protein [Ruminococcus sp.]|nr:polyphosphate polymerase domain-containing protein [Ruminococcus sp.]MCM1380695.1 polyphosphate polymerase domain-containing protein [Muribaculaceae bacterium]MCM1480768.1 polyphosphate polymerase domain-containing protein [Muribaculaceae bacterium]
MSTEKYRHELKHSISRGDFLMLTGKIGLIASPDENMRGGEYFIRSLYFDSYSDKALREKLDGFGDREKFRIRFYNMDDGFIKLEKKSKHAGLCLKKTAPLLRAETERIIAGDFAFLENSDEPLCRELYIKMLTDRLRPKTIVDYRRKAYVFPYGNVRVTFDYDISSSYDLENFFGKTSQIPVPNEIIMEVKYDEFLPQIIADITQLGGRQSGSFSKYAAARYV